MKLEKMRLEEIKDVTKIGYLGEYPVEYIKLENDILEAEMEITEKALNHYGMAHGAVGYGFADTLAGSICFLHNDDVVTANSDVYYLRPILPGKIYGRASYVRKGRRGSVVEVSVYQNEKMCLRATINMATINRPPENLGEGK